MPQHWSQHSIQLSSIQHDFRKVYEEAADGCPPPRPPPPPPATPQAWARPCPFYATRAQRHSLSPARPRRPQGPALLGKTRPTLPPRDPPPLGPHPVAANWSPCRAGLEHLLARNAKTMPANWCYNCFRPPRKCPSGLVLHGPPWHGQPTSCSAAIPMYGAPCSIQGAPCSSL